MSKESEAVVCPICRPQIDAEECVFMTVRKKKNGKTTLCCCPQQEKVKKGEQS